MSRVRRFATVAARLVPHRWGWAEDNAGPIAEHWARRIAERPAMFNGRVLMLAGLDADGDALAADFFETDYASMTAWLDLGRPDRSVANGFAMGALRSSDGLFILGRMAAHTANAGELYFPAGTPDRADVTHEGEVDLAGSLLREITEETGLGPADWTVEPDWTVVEAEGRTAFLRMVRLGEPATAACRRIERFLAGEAGPELSGVETVASLTDLDDTMPAYLTAFLREALPHQIE